MKMKIRIGFADDHPLVREGLRQLIADTGDMQVAFEAAHGQEMVEKIKKIDIDVAILDISMPGRCGIDVLKEIKLIKPGLPVLVLSMHPKEVYAMRVLKSGGAGYITKDHSTELLVDAIRTVYRGKIFVSSKLEDMLADEITGAMDKLPHENLTDREFHIMMGIAMGFPIRKIASELVLNARTVSTYRCKIMDKMGMKNNADLVQYAREHSLLKTYSM